MSETRSYPRHANSDAGEIEFRLIASVPLWSVPLVQSCFARSGGRRQSPPIGTFTRRFKEINQANRTVGLVRCLTDLHA
jgi:hypothetical protein